MLYGGINVQACTIHELPYTYQIYYGMWSSYHSNNYSATVDDFQYYIIIMY